MIDLLTWHQIWHVIKRPGYGPTFYVIWGANYASGLALLFRRRH